jgi:hypothetical protein
MDALRRASPLFAWRLEIDQGIHSERRKWPRLNIRGAPKAGPHTRVDFEPMGALWYAMTGEALEPKAWARAGDALGLLPVRAAELHAAGNDATWAGEERSREPVEYLQALRQRLTEAVGLSVPVTSAPVVHR